VAKGWDFWIGIGFFWIGIGFFWIEVVIFIFDEEDFGYKRRIFARLAQLVRASVL